MDGKGASVSDHCTNGSHTFPKRVTPQFEEEPLEAGPKFYDDVFDELEKYGIEPLVTISHYELPYGMVSTFLRVPAFRDPPAGRAPLTGDTAKEAAVLPAGFIPHH